MRTNFPIIGNLRCGLAVTAVALLLGGSAVAQPFTSPVGNTWDVIMSGCREGVALMDFNSDGTFSMQETLEFKLKSAPAVTRGNSGGDTRDGSGSDTNGLPVHTNLYGYYSIPHDDYVATNADGGAIWLHYGEQAGFWGYNIAGKIVGFFTETTAAFAITTNLIPMGDPVVFGCTNVVYTDTNGVPQITTLCLTNQPFLTNVEYLRLTNSQSFVGKIATARNPNNSRLTLVVSTPSGKSTFVGLPQLDLTDISGSYYGTKRELGLPYNEFFTMTAEGGNVYDVTGVGPGYTYPGIAIVSRQKKIGFVASIIRPHEPIVDPSTYALDIRSVFGPVNLKTMRFFTVGWEGDTDVPDRISFNGYLSPLPR